MTSINNNNNNNLTQEILVTKSITMDLENLQQQYSNLLVSYNKAISEYTNFLNEQSNGNQNENNDPFVSIKGMAFNGTGVAGDSNNANTLQECKAACSKLTNCTGATFVSNQCLLRTGDSPIVSSSENSYAIIPKSKKLLLEIENINQLLISINQKITNQISKSEPLYNNQQSERSEQEQTLLKNYSELLWEREKILKLLEDYDNLDDININQTISINQNYYTYILLFILVIGIVVILFKMSVSNTISSVVTEPTIQYGGDLGISAYVIVFIIILLVILLRYFSQ